MGRWTEPELISNRPSIALWKRPERSFGLGASADDERILIEKVYWDGAGNSELYNYFGEKRFPGKTLTGVEKVRFEAWVRQEKCRVTKKFRSLMRGPKL